MPILFGFVYVEDELPTEIIIDISKTLYAFLFRIIEEHRHTVDVLITICRLELIMLEIQNDPITVEQRLAWFEKAFHYAQLADDLDLLEHNEIAPFINILVVEQSKLPSTSEAYKRIDQLGVKIYRKLWDRFKMLVN